MGHTYESLSPAQREWIAAQQMFFVSTAPLARDGHVNSSPKGRDTFRILGDSEVAYLDFIASGVETIAHLQENGRIVIMFCAFSGPPRIMRLHGVGEVLYPGTPEFQRLAPLFTLERGVRAIIRVRVTRLSDSCGYSVPLYNFVGHRDALSKWAATKSDDELAEYQRKKNSKSIDGLPGVPT